MNTKEVALLLTGALALTNKQGLYVLCTYNLELLPPLPRQIFDRTPKIAPDRGDESYKVR